MAEQERVRIEIGFDGGQIIGGVVDGRDGRRARAGARGRAGTASFDARRRGRRATRSRSRRVVYVKRFARESRVGFGAARLSAVALEVGIVGLPGAGKTTLFNALTKAGARGTAYDGGKTNVGMAPIADERLDALARGRAARRR